MRNSLTSHVGILLLAAVLGMGDTVRPAFSQSKPEWTSPCRFRTILTVDARDRRRSYSPASVEVDFQAHLVGDQRFDQGTVEIIALDEAGRPKVFDESRPEAERWLVPHRIDRLFGGTKASLNFVMRDHTCTKFAVYFDAVESKGEQSRPYSGMLGDGDLFCEEHQRREINASHFDQFVDFDGDGDLDLFKGGVEPFVYCFENVGGNRMTARGRLASGDQLFTLPCSKDRRSWVTVAFYDVDGDGDQDFLPSFGDGPDAGQIVLYRNTTGLAGQSKTFTFVRVGPLRTDSGAALAGGAQEGGWFPSIALVKDFDGEASGRLDALVGSNHRCWLYRGLGTQADGSPRFSDAVAVKADGRDINLVNPRFDCADIDGDGDLDLFSGTQPGPIWFFKNVGTRTNPTFGAGQVIALNGKYLIGDAHSGVKVADFDGDGLLDIVAGCFWERTDLNQPDGPRDFGGFFRNMGSRTQPRLERATTGAPFTEQFQICDAVRQNCVRAIDWDRDGKTDLLAGDTDGLIWLFRNKSSQLFPLFAPGEKLQAGGRTLSVASSGGHARFDVCDWNNDGDRDLIVADGQGTLTLFQNKEGSTERERPKSAPALEAGHSVIADAKPIRGQARASVLVCDWDNDGRKDVIFADEKGYYWHRNVGTDASPKLAAGALILFNGRPVSYVRPNLGSCVDWDSDGRRDFIGCHFENSIRWYRNLGAGQRGAEPRFNDAEGIVILQASSPQMISGAHALDWNGDGDVDILTGQGHGGSGLRFYERDWVEDEIHGTHPLVSAGAVEARQP